MRLQEFSVTNFRSITKTSTFLLLTNYKPLMPFCLYRFTQSTIDFIGIFLLIDT